MNLDREIEGAFNDLAQAVEIFDEPFDDSFKETLSQQERFRYEVLVFMKKNGFKLINSKCFKKKDVYIPVSDIESFYKENDSIDLEEILFKLELVKTC